MKKASAAAVSTAVSTTGAAVAQGVELAGQVSATAAEMLRTRRDPAVQAQKRRRAAQRRVRAWSAGAVLTGGVTAAAVFVAVDGTVSAGTVLALVLLSALLIYCIVGVVKAAADLRARNRVIAALPAPSPSRPAVAAELRPQMSRLDGYSDGLRHLVGMIGIVDDDPSLRELRDEIVTAADVSEARLRRQAKDLTGLLKARRTAPPAAGAQLDATADGLRKQIQHGVAGYGELVSAASEAVAASRNLADQHHRAGSGALPAGGPIAGAQGTLHPELEHPIDQLRSLAAGMRELTQG